MKTTRKKQNRKVGKANNTKNAKSSEVIEATSNTAFSSIRDAIHASAAAHAQLAQAENVVEKYGVFGHCFVVSFVVVSFVLWRRA